MPAKRDYADAWRDAWVTLTQVPVAGLLATNYFYQQSVERWATYLSQVSARIALARPAALVAGADGENVMADVLSEDLIDMTRVLVRGCVGAPAETAEFFTRQLESMIDELLRRIQPDAATDVGTYVVNELDKLNRTLAGLREVAAAETARELLARPAREPARPDAHDVDALTGLLADLKKIAEPPMRQEGQSPGEADTLPREKMLLVVGAVVSAALKRFSPKIQPAPELPDEARRAAVEKVRLRLAVKDAEARLAEAIEDERRGILRPPARRAVASARRMRR